MVETLANLVHNVAWWLTLISVGIIALSLGMRFTNFIPEPYFLINRWPVPEFLLIVGVGGLLISVFLKFAF